MTSYLYSPEGFKYTFFGYALMVKRAGKWTVLSNCYATRKKIIMGFFTVNGPSSDLYSLHMFCLPDSLNKHIMMHIMGSYSLGPFNYFFARV